MKWKHIFVNKNYSFQLISLWLTGKNQTISSLFQRNKILKKLFRYPRDLYQRITIKRLSLLWFSFDGQNQLNWKHRSVFYQLPAYSNPLPSEKHYVLVRAESFYWWETIFNWYFRHFEEMFTIICEHRVDLCCQRMLPQA